MSLSACSHSSNDTANGTTNGTTQTRGGADKGTNALTFAVFQPFTGPDASFGPELMAGCEPAVAAIVAAGGILHHPSINCLAADSRGDAADAVPAAAKLIATESGLVGVSGPSSDEATATVGLFNQSKIPVFADTGQSLYNKNTMPYFWRITPADDAVGYAMALWAHDKGYGRVAAVFGNDISSQGAEPTVTSGFTRMGGQISIDQKLKLGQPSYRSEVEQLISTHPDAVFMEADPQTSATYLAELKQLSGMIPIIGSGGTIQPPWQKAVSGAIGASDFGTYYVAAQPYAPSTGPAYAAWTSALNAAASKVTQPTSQWTDDPYAESAYDSINVMALAMEAAGSTTPSVYNNFITQVTSAAPGSTVVHDFASGKAALVAGKHIQYIGATGEFAFDASHNSPGGYEVVTSSGQNLKAYTAAQIAKAAAN